MNPLDPQVFEQIRYAMTTPRPEGTVVEDWCECWHCMGWRAVDLVESHIKELEEEVERLRKS